MAHIVFIQGSYYPNFTATSKCSDHIIQEIKKRHTVSVICYQDLSIPSEICHSDKYDDLNIIRVSTPRNKFINWVVKNKKLNSKVKKVFLFAGRLLSLFIFILKKSSLNNALVKSFESALDSCHKSRAIDLIIPISFPFEGLVSASNYKKKHNDVSLIPYLFDPFTDNVSLHRFSWLKAIRNKKHYQIEREVYENSNKIFIINHLLKTSIANMDNNIKKKLVVTEHPVLIKPEFTHWNNNNHSSSNLLNLSYTGALYAKIRRPNYLLELLSRMNNNFDFQMNMYSFGNCERILEDYKKSLHDRLILHGRVSVEEAQSAINNADILISIGNTTSTQTPSKIFEYMSFGKPIIHIYSINDDIIVHTLAKYPLSLCIREDEQKIDENVKMLAEFCEKYAGKSISFEETAELFKDAVPEYVAKQFESFIITEN